MCVFCDKIKSGNIIHQMNKAFCLKDEYPVTIGHALIVPLRCVASYWDLTKEELDDTRRMIEYIGYGLMANDETIEGFNIGWNVGKVAGQTVMHAHCHLIPRRKGDVDNPTGGIRNVRGTEIGDWTT